MAEREGGCAEAACAGAAREGGSMRGSSMHPGAPWQLSFLLRERCLGHKGHISALLRPWPKDTSLQPSELWLLWVTCTPPCCPAGQRSHKSMMPCYTKVAARCGEMGGIWGRSFVPHLPPPFVSVFRPQGPLRPHTAPLKAGCKNSFQREPEGS